MFKYSGTQITVCRSLLEGRLRNLAGEWRKKQIVITYKLYCQKETKTPFLCIDLSEVRFHGFKESPEKTLR